MFLFKFRSHGLSVRCPCLLKLVGRKISTEPCTIEDLQKKIVYNCVLFKNEIENSSFSKRQQLIYRLRNERNNITNSKHGAICLKYLEDDNKKEEVETTPPPDAPVHFPFNKVKALKFKDGAVTEAQEYEEQDLTWAKSHDKMVKHMVNEKNWMPHSPEIVNDAIIDDTQNFNLKYGSADPEVPVSNVKCGGCGALLHCQVSNVCLHKACTCSLYIPRNLYK